MQAGAWEAVAGAALQGADDRAAGHHVTDRHARAHRFVRRTQATVVDHHHPTPCESGGEGDRPPERGVHLLSDVTEQVDPAMAGTPSCRGWVEPLDHLRTRRQRPDPVAGRCGSRLGVGGRGEQWRGEEQGREQEGEEAHACTVPSRDRAGDRMRPGCGSGGSCGWVCAPTGPDQPITATGHCTRKKTSSTEPLNWSGEATGVPSGPVLPPIVSGRSSSCDGTRRRRGAPGPATGPVVVRLHGELEVGPVALAGDGVPRTRVHGAVGLDERLALGPLDPARRHVVVELDLQLAGTVEGAALDEVVPVVRLAARGLLVELEAGAEGERLGAGVEGAAACFGGDEHRGWCARGAGVGGEPYGVTAVGTVDRLDGGIARGPDLDVYVGSAGVRHGAHAVADQGHRLEVEHERGRRNGSVRRPLVAIGAPAAGQAEHHEQDHAGGHPHHATSALSSPGESPSKGDNLSSARPRFDNPTGPRIE